MNEKEKNFFECRDISELDFKRIFSCNFRKNLTFTISKMTFTSDFVNGKNSNLYPILFRNGECGEYVEDSAYRHCTNDGGVTARLFGNFFPYASYEICACENDESSRYGFVFVSENKRATLMFCRKNGHLVAEFESGGEKKTAESAFEISRAGRVVVSCRPGAFDIYAGFELEYVATFGSEEWMDSASYSEFTRINCGVLCKGNTEVFSVKSYMDCGIAQADIRPVKYENGECIVNNGKIFLTMSVRLQEGCYQGIFEWTPGICEFNFIGALFFDYGDGVWSNDVASCVVYDRNNNDWIVWVCSFSHGHIAAYSKCKNEFLHGINVIYAKLLEKIPEGADDKCFFGKEGDEDPDLLYDESSGKWYLCICRLADLPQGKTYRYFVFTSDEPLGKYVYLSNSFSGSETGGTLVKDASGIRLICGNMPDYRCYTLPDMKTSNSLKCNFPDGGFRGWGTVIPVKAATRTRYFWLTFDRYLPSGYNWSYGNIYCFEGIN